MEASIESQIADWKKKFGEDVQVTMRYIDGSCYRDKPVCWFGQTKKFKVGPHSCLNEVLEELGHLHKREPGRVIPRR